MRVLHLSFAWRLGFLYAALFLVVGCYLPYLPIWLSWRSLDADQIAVLLATFRPAHPSRNVAFNPGGPVNSTTLVLPDLHFSPAWGALTSASGGSAVNGSVSFPAGDGVVIAGELHEAASRPAPTSCFALRRASPACCCASRAKNPTPQFV